MKKNFLPALVLGAIAIFLVLALTLPAADLVPAPRASVKLNELRVPVELADTPEKMRLGLGERDSIPASEGMLFPYSSKTPVVFWMKGMRFPLDIIWIADGQVIQIDANIQPEPGVPDSSLKFYTPNEPVDFVLEVNAGFVEKNNIKVGDDFTFQTQSDP